MTVYTVIILTAMETLTDRMGHRALPVLVLGKRCLIEWVACRATIWAYGRAVKSRKVASSKTSNSVAWNFLSHFTA